jgi:hypothetical protein
VLAAIVRMSGLFMAAFVALLLSSTPGKAHSGHAQAVRTYAAPVQSVTRSLPAVIAVAQQCPGFAGCTVCPACAPSALGVEAETPAGRLSPLVSHAVVEPAGLAGTEAIPTTPPPRFAA